MRFVWIYILLIVIAGLSACTDDVDNAPEIFTGSEYYPLKTGNVLIYEVTEITIDKPSAYYDTIVYYLKERVDIELIDNEGDTAFRIERFRRFSPTENWVIHSVWQSKQVDNTAQKVEENHRIVKIRFPARKGLSWNGNLYNELEPQDFRISSINTGFTFDAYSFDSCLTVMHDSSNSLIHKDLAYEIYSHRLGLIYKEKTYLNSQEVIFDVPIEDRITTGTIYIQKLIATEVD